MRHAGPAWLTSRRSPDERLRSSEDHPSGMQYPILKQLLESLQTRPRGSAQTQGSTGTCEASERRHRDTSSAESPSAAFPGSLPESSGAPAEGGSPVHGSRAARALPICRMGLLGRAPSPALTATATPPLVAARPAALRIWDWGATVPPPDWLGAPGHVEERWHCLSSPSSRRPLLASSPVSGSAPAVHARARGGSRWPGSPAEAPVFSRPTATAMATAAGRLAPCPGGAAIATERLRHTGAAAGRPCQRRREH